MISDPFKVLKIFQEDKLYYYYYLRENKFKKIKIYIYNLSRL
jgi:hypothetical protein